MSLWFRDALALHSPNMMSFTVLVSLPFFPCYALETLYVISFERGSQLMSTLAYVIENEGLLGCSWYPFYHGSWRLNRGSEHINHTDSSIINLTWMLTILNVSIPFDESPILLPGLEVAARPVQSSFIPFLSSVEKNAFLFCYIYFFICSAILS